MDSPKRQIGPVTTAATGGAAAAGIIAWLIETLAGIDVPTDVQTYMSIVLVILAGWIVPPRGTGRRIAE